MEASPKTRDELHRLVDALPDGETHAAKRYLEYLRDRKLPGLDTLLSAPEEDEELTDAAKKRLRQRFEEVRSGETVAHQEVRREIGL